MDMDAIISELVEERNNLSRSIEALEQLAGRGGVTAKVKSRRGRKSMDEKARMEVSERMTRYWARRRAERSGGGKSAVNS